MDWKAWLRLDGLGGPSLSVGVSPCAARMAGVDGGLSPVEAKAGWFSRRDVFLAEGKGKLQCTGASHALACITFAVTLLAKAKHMSKSKVKR